MKKIFCILFICMSSFCIGIVYIIYRCGYILEDRQKRVDKFYAYFNLLDQWMCCKEQDLEFVDFFTENNIRSVSIYGMGKIGRHLAYELVRNGIKIEYVIDEGENALYGKEPHYNLQDDLPDVDAVIVTPIDIFDNIKDEILKKNKKMQVISLKTIVEWIERH